MNTFTFSLNKTFKAILILQLMLAGLIANAQTRGGTNNSQTYAEKDLAELKQAVAPTDAQVELLTPIVYNYADEKREAYDTYRNDPAGLKAELTGIDKRMDKELFTVLTPEQQEKWKEHRKNQASKASGPMIRQ